MGFNDLTASGLLSAGTSIVNGFLNRKSVKDTNATNIKIAQMNNEASLQAMRENNQWSKDTAKEFFDMENAYNDPSSVRERLENAGYNPFFQSDNSAMVNSGDASTPTAGSVPALQMPQISPVPSVLNGALQDITSAMVNVANAKKTGVDTKNAESLISRQIREMDIKNDWNNFLAELDKTFAWSDREWQNESTRFGVQKLSQEVNKLVQDIINTQKQGELYDVQKAIAEFDKSIKKSQLEWTPKMLKQEFINAVKQGNAIDASADASRASAENSRSSAKLSDRQRELLGKTINGIEVDPATIKNWERQLNQSNINKSQQEEIQHYISEIKKGKLNNWDTRAFIHLSTELEYVPLLGDMLKFLSKFAK